MTLVERINAAAEVWSGAIVRGFIEASLLLLAVALVYGVFRRRMSVQLAHGLFLLVLLKLAIPFSIEAPAKWLNYWPAAAVEVEMREIAVAARQSLMAAPSPGAEPLSLPAPSGPLLASVSPSGDQIVDERVGETLHFRAALMIAWGAVVSLLLAGLVIRAVGMNRRLLLARPLARDELSVDVVELSRKAKLRRPPLLLEVSWLDSPAVWGVWRPAVLVPPRMVEFLTASEMTWVLLHEFHHIRRRDTLVLCFQRIMQIVYFFHPGVWIANRMIDVTREYACDDAAMLLGAIPRRECGMGFLAVVERIGVRSPSCPPLLGLMYSKTLIRSRLMRILNVNRPLQSSLSLGSFLILALSAAISLPRLLASQAQNQPPPVPAAARSGGPTDISGVVRGPEGESLAGVKITATEIYREVNFVDGVLEEDGLGNRPFLLSDAEGRYRFGPQTKEYGVFACHEKGYARKSAAELAESADLKLEPWSTVKGVAKIGGKPLANAPIRFTLDATDRHSMSYDVYEYHAVTDEAGRFQIEHVPAGVGVVRMGDRLDKDSSSPGRISSAKKQIKPGETVQMNLGGEGRPVVGRLQQPAGAPIQLSGGRLIKLVKEPPLLGPDATKDWDAEKRFRYYFDAYRSPEALQSRLAQRIVSLQIAPDGAFRAEEAPPGDYLLTFWVGDDFQHPLLSKQVAIPGPNGDPAAAFDLKTIEIRTAGDK